MKQIEYNKGEERLNGPSTVHTTHGGWRRCSDVRRLQQRNPKFVIRWVIMGFIYYSFFFFLKAIYGNIPSLDHHLNFILILKLCTYI